MYEPMSGLGLGAVYEGAGRTTTETTNPPPATGAAATTARNTGASVAGALGLQLPALLALGALAVILVRIY